MLAHNFRDGPFVGFSSGSPFYTGFQSPHHLDDSQSLSGSIPSPGFFSQDDQVSSSLGQQSMLHQMQHHVHHNAVGVGSDPTNSVHGSPVKNQVQYGSYAHPNGHQHPHLMQQSHQTDQRTRSSKKIFLPIFFDTKKNCSSPNN